jgi:hypothetical protein
MTWSDMTPFRIVFRDDDGGSAHLWNVGRQLFYTEVHPRRQFWISYSTPLELEISHDMTPCRNLSIRVALSQNWWWWDELHATNIFNVLCIFGIWTDHHVEVSVTFLKQISMYRLSVCREVCDNVGKMFQFHLYSRVCIRLQSRKYAMLSVFALQHAMNLWGAGVAQSV